MRLIIDGKPYEVDGDFFVRAWYEATAPYLSPETPEGKRYADIRLAAKAALRLRLGAILKIFATVFRVDDWRELQPQRGEDMLVKLHQYTTGLLRVEAHHLVVEMASENSDESGSDHADTGIRTPTRLALTSAGFDGGQTLYQRPDSGRAFRDTTGQHPALSASASGGGLEPDADPPEV